MLQSHAVRPSTLASDPGPLARTQPEVANIGEVPSPALLVLAERVTENIRRMIAAADGASRLRPHVKTHKCAEVLRLQMDAGISKFKCATIAEAEMCALAGAPDLLLAYQPVGPNIERLLRLIERFPETRFACVADNADTIRALAAAAARASRRVPVYLDIDCGQRRSGVAPGADAKALWDLLKSQPALEAAGLHAYDGHIHVSNAAEREAMCEAAFAPVEALRRELHAPLIVAGGSPTFPFHARRQHVECSPGTNVFWDAGYAENFPDQDYLFAVWLLARVASKPAADRICLDLGHKAVASESPHPRVIFPALPEARPLMHNEEHLVLETPRAAQIAIGTPFYGLPWHVCPTVALHQELVVVHGNLASGAWRIASRDRRISI